ncbi:hypothetical protein G7Y79_00011g030810 [Physcia stellaris]|nr:hypothetical protein G7Y79_00011g030810 [Physcia stellaris]
MWLSAFAFAVLSTCVLPIQAYDYSTAKLCTTKYGPKSTSAKTTSYALTIPVTITNKFTTTSTSTITPPPQTTTTTTTSTATATVFITPTSTFTETDTETDTTTITATITTDTTITVTTTSSVATTTVPTPAGFTPIANEPGYVPKKRSIEAAAPAIRGRYVEARTSPKVPACPPIGKPGSFSQYPQSVTCGALVVAKTTTTKTFTASTKATTTLPASTNTITSTATTTETTTSLAAPASTTTTTTTTVIETDTATETATNTVTQTVTAVQASSTVYAACSSNNVINRANGNQGVNVVSFNGNGPAPTTNEVAISDAVACCAQCQQTAGCNGYAQYPGAARCFLFSNGQCDASQNFGQFFQTNAGFSPSSGYTIGNGPCGQLDNGGSG